MSEYDTTDILRWSEHQADALVEQAIAEFMARDAGKHDAA